MPKIPASERDAFYESRRTEIAEAALRLWAERGFDQTSVATIAKECGVAKGTFYLYFESKEALLEDVFRRNSLVPNVQALIEALESQDLDQAVHAFVRAAWRHLCEHRELVLIVLREIPTHLEQAQQLVGRVLVPANRLLAEYLEARVDRDAEPALSLVIAARGLLGMVIFVFLTQEILGAGKFLPCSEEQITDTIAGLFLNGLTTPAAPGGSPA